MTKTETIKRLDAMLANVQQRVHNHGEEMVRTDASKAMELKICAIDIAGIRLAMETALIVSKGE